MMSLGIVAMGLAVGFLVGLTGVGAASLLTPFLVFIGIHPSLAVGTDLVYNSVTKLFGAIQHWRQRTIQFRIVKYLALGSIPSAVVAIGVLHLLNAQYHNEEPVIKHALGVVLIVVAGATLFKVFFDKKIRPNRWQLKNLNEKRGLTIGIGAGFGFLVGLTSIGSGSLFAIALLYLFRMTASELVGTDIAHAFLLASVAGMMNVGFGNVNYLLAGNLLIGSVPGVLLGSFLSARVPSKPLRAVMSVLILISGLKLI
jgi:uncharacterized membrane protein YfcA